MTVTITTGQLYAYDGSLASIETGGLLSTSLLNFGSSESGTISDNNGLLTQSDDGQTTLTLADGSTGTIDYLGSGTVATIGLLGLRIDPRPVAVFVLNGQIYFYAPEGMPLLSGLTFDLAITSTGTFDLEAAANGVVEGRDTSETMGLGYTDLQGDKITTANDAIYGFGGNDTIAADAGNDTVFGGTGNDSVSGQAGDDNLSGDDGDDRLFGGDGRDTLIGGAGADQMTGGAGADVFVTEGTGDVILDFDATTGIGDADSTNNDFVDLSAYYNDDTLDLWNAANPDQTFGNALGWLRADMADGILDAAEGLQIKSGGTSVSGASLTAENTGVICFATGTRISTINGFVAVEDLQVGDSVLTRDMGFQQVRWIGCRMLSGHDLRTYPALRPILIRQGALGNGLPERDLTLTRQHRVLVQSPMDDRMFGERELLLAAKDLVGLAGVQEVTTDRAIAYWHILFDDHQVVYSENAPTESLFLGPEACKTIPQAALEELQTLFPDLPHGGKTLARQEVRGAKARLLVNIVAAHGRPLTAISTPRLNARA